MKFNKDIFLFQCLWHWGPSWSYSECAPSGRSFHLSLIVLWVNKIMSSNNQTWIIISKTLILKNFIVISTTRCTATLLSAQTTRTHGRRGWSQQSSSPFTWSSPSSMSITRSRLFLKTQGLECLRRVPLHTERWNDHRISKVLLWMHIERLNFR